jgi:hypothetical protein
MKVEHQVYQYPSVHIRQHPKKQSIEIKIEERIIIMILLEVSLLLCQFEYHELKRYQNILFPVKLRLKAFDFTNEKHMYLLLLLYFGRLNRILWYQWIGVQQ